MQRGRLDQRVVGGQTEVAAALAEAGSDPEDLGDV